MPDKKFSERLNKELDSIGVPSLQQERIDALAKLLKIPKFKAESMLNGIIPNLESLTHLAKELEVNTDWLIGKNTSRQSN